MADCNPPPALLSPEHDLDPVAASVAAIVVFDGATIGIDNGVQLGVDTHFGSTDQASSLVAGLPFFDRRLESVRCAFS